MPEPADPDHLARLHVDGRAPIDPAAALHLRTIPLRHTDRRPVTGEPVEPQATWKPSPRLSQRRAPGCTP